MTQANAYSDLVPFLPWLPKHVDALKSPMNIHVSLLDVLLIDLATATAVSWAHDLDMPSVIDRLHDIQRGLRRQLTDAGLPYSKDEDNATDDADPEPA